jgi:hypothetical protein
MRALLFFVIIALLVLLAHEMGWVTFSRSSGPNRDTIGVTVNKDDVKRDVDNADTRVKEWGEKARERVRDLGRKDDTSSNVEKPALLVSRYAIALEPGSRTDVMVTRTGNDLTPTDLQITTTPGSNLVVAGGKFANGERQTVISIAAPPGAVDGRIDLATEHAKESITVEVKSQPASMWEPNPQFPRVETYKF